MGEYIVIHNIRKGMSFGSERIGGAGSGTFLVEQWIAGWSMSPVTLNNHARKVWNWFVYRGKDPEVRKTWNLLSRKKMAAAMRDQTEKSSWIFGTGLERIDLDRIKNPQLYSLVLLWRLPKNYSEFDAHIKITDDLAAAVARGTTALESLGTAWAEQCRMLCDLVQKGHQEGCHISIG